MELTRKIIFTTLAFLFICHTSIIAQHKKGVLIYEAQNIRGYTWEDKIAESNLDSIQSSNARKRIEEFLGKRKKEEELKKKKPFIWEYHFNKAKARVIGNKVYQGKTFGIYDYKENTRIVRRYHKGNPNDFRIDSVDYNFINGEKEFEVEIFRDSTKIIRGFDCYKIEIVEKWGYDKRPSLFYEIYVTDSIHFPVNALMHIPVFVSNSCPVSIKHWGLRKENYFSAELISFNKNLRKKMLKVPKEFKGKQ